MNDNQHYKTEEERGAAYVELWRQHPELLHALLGNFYDTSPRGIFLRRLLLAINIPPQWLEIVESWMVNSGVNEKWSVFRQQYCFWWAVRRAIGNREVWKRLTYGVPILMYHAFAGKGENASRYVVPILKFKAQLWLLKHLGFHVISLDEYLNCLEENHLPPEKAVVITIDDGYEDNYLLAFPLLKHFGFHATIFLVSDYMGATNRWDKDSVLTGRALFDDQEAKEMQNSSISFGAHTCTHPHLTQLSEQEIWEEITKSKVDLEQRLGIPIRLFSYPYGDYDNKVAAVVKEAGLEGACTVKTGLNTFQMSAFTLRRTEIFGTFSLWRFLRAVSSGV